MKTLISVHRNAHTALQRRGSVALGLTLTLASRAFAQGNSPLGERCKRSANGVHRTLAKGLALVAIVVGGLTFAFGEGGGKKTFAGIVFGLGMAVLAVNFLSWLFGV